MTHHRIDHLLFGAPDLEQGLALIHTRLGVRPIYGGRHPGSGTHNALLSLGPDTYLEIIAPDPAQDIPATRIPYGLAHLQAPGLITWAVRPHAWDLYLRRLHNLGLVVAIQDKGRTRPDGQQLHWRSTRLPFPAVVGQADMACLIPFAIEWQTSAHPAATAPGELTLQELTLQHPDLAALQQVVEDLALPVRTEQTAHPGLVAMIDTPGGIVLLT